MTEIYPKPIRDCVVDLCHIIEERFGEPHTCFNAMAERLKLLVSETGGTLPNPDFLADLQKLRKGAGY